MTDAIEIDYGPLTHLLGTWTGDKGLDIAPDPEGKEQNPYYETLVFTAKGLVENAASQQLAVLHYHQSVQRKSNNQSFHDQCGYWMWDKNAGLIMHSLTIPRAVCVLAGGPDTKQKDNEGRYMLTVSANINDKIWQIIQSPFMQNNAKTIAFQQQLVIGENTLSYKQTTVIEIYGKTFEHTDKNELIRLDNNSA